MSATPRPTPGDRPGAPPRPPSLFDAVDGDLRDTPPSGQRAADPFGYADGAVSLAEERDRLRAVILDGTRCRCCRRRVQLYRRTLGAGMAVALLSFFRASENLPAHHDGFLHAEDTFKEDRRISSAARGDFTKLRHWGLIEKAEGEREDGSPRNGHYRMTERGRMFCQRRLHVRPAVYEYNGEVYPPPAGADDTPVDIVDALGKRFDYAELMTGVVVREARAAKRAQAGAMA